MSHLNQQKKAEIRANKYVLCAGYTVYLDSVSHISYHILISIRLRGRLLLLLGVITT